MIFRRGVVMALAAFFALSFSFIVLGGTAMDLTSPDFVHNGNIPARFTCSGEDISPNLQIAGVPVNTKSLALIVDDPDASSGDWVHWVVFNIPPVTKVILQDTVPGVQGGNDFQRQDWGGPCPPKGTHRYFFKIYALDILLDLKRGAKKEELLSSMQGHILDKAELVGLFKRF